MFRLKALGVSILGAAMALAIHGPATAQEIMLDVPPGSEGARVFSFHYHPVPEVDGTRYPGNLLIGELPAPVRLDPAELFNEYGDSPRVLEAPGIPELIEQSLEGGFAASFSDMVLTELAVMQKNCVSNGAPVKNAVITPKESSLRLHTNPIRTNAVLNIYSWKTLTCGEDGNLISIPLKRRWVISISSGLEQGPIDKTIGGVQMTYKMFAQGKTIKLMAYYSNLTLHGKRWQDDMRLISGFDQFGNVDPRNKYYTPKAASCLDIDFKNKPPNDVDVWSVAPSDMRFCARGCIPGDVSATK